ncbi:MAG TPA: KTSC domain-containing protein [Methanoregulaceae archaeon]|nr:KTSC domain-containing protein [Methanoregulaceae archaeon]
MEPRWTHLTSSLLEAVAYDPAERRLRIRFRSGAIYDYDGVPPVVYDELLAAPSKGGYFSEYIRPEYSYRRVRGAEEGMPTTAR